MIRWVILFVLAALPLRAEVNIQAVTSPGGIKAWLVEERSIPFTALEIRFLGGAALDMPEKRGATNLMMGLLEEGTGELDNVAFATELEELAASLRFRAYDDSVTVSARFLSENQEEVIALLHRALTEPNFDEAAIDRVRRQVIAGIRSDAQNPNSIASRYFDEAAFGEHPYATSIDGTEESIGALTRNDLFDAKDRVLTRDRIFIGAVGDIDADTLGLLLDQLFEGLPETGPTLPQEVAFSAEPEIEVVDYDSPQSVVMFGHAGIDREDDDFFAALVMNQVLGAGGFSSRLTDEVRENRGLTYGIGSYLVSREYSDYIVGQFSSDNSRVAEAINIVRSEWKRMADDGVTGEELDAAITYLTGAYPLRFDGNESIANILAGMQIQGLERDYINYRNDLVRAVTKADIARVAERLLKEDALYFVVVGQPDGL